MQRLKIAIVGCGPGGMTLSLFLKKNGHRPIIFDQFDEPQSVGSGLLIQPSGQRVLEQLDLLESLKSRSAPVRSLLGFTMPSGQRALDMAYRHIGEDICALGVHRASLFSILHDEVRKADIEIHSSCKLRSIDNGRGHIRPVFERDRDIGKFDLLIDCSGANSPLSEECGKMLQYGAVWASVDIPANNYVALAKLEQRYNRASSMAGIMPIGINPETGNQGAAIFWSVRNDKVAELLREPVEKWQRAFLDLWPEAEAYVKQVSTTGQLTWAQYRHRTGRPRSHNRVFHLGDSWHATSPQLGQGANMAMLDAIALAQAINAGDDLNEAENYYRHYRSDHVHLYQALSAFFTPLYQSDSRLLPAVRDFLIHYFARWPLIRRLIAHIVSGGFGQTRY